MNSVSFYGGETCGVPAERRIETAKQETAGSVGYRKFQAEPEIKLDTLDKDTVNFRGREDNDKKEGSVLGTLFGIGATAAIVIGGLGLAHKYNVLDKLNSPKIKEYGLKVTEPCYKWCASVTKFCKDNYQKVVDKFSKK